ncbi:MAG: transcription termination factor NusA [Parcubacteria group bacterium]|jgi:N utilization substance protein A
MAKKQEETNTGINSNEFNSAISQICDEKGIDKDKVMQTVEAALAAAYKKDYGKKSQNIRAEIGGGAEGVKFFLIKEVVDETVREFVNLSEEDEEKTLKKEFTKENNETEEEKMPRFNPERDIKLEDALLVKKDAKIGDIIETELEAQESYGRVAAQTAKQVIIQRIREAEKDAMYEEYKGKEGEILNGVVQRIEGQNIFIDLGKATGVLFPSEQVRGENYKIGQRLKVYLGKIEADNRGPGIILSRTHPEMVRRLFELEVPEIFSGTVEIKAIAREAGSRTKIAVIAKEDGIDPIGSCVGQKGTRVQAIIDELGGEKIDIIEWNENIEKFITAALSPAKVLAVKIKNEEAKEATAIVPSDQLSLAIGQKGQNVRLAAKLTNWKIDVVGDEIKIEKIKKEEETVEKIVSEKEKEA